MFNVEDVTRIAIEKQEEIRNNVANINKFMNEHDKNNEPNITIGKQCSNPYACDFWEYCTRNLENSELTSQTSEQNIKPIINREEIKKLLDDLKYPLYFIDYETYMEVIPEIEKTRPYQQLPFQYSLHILKDEDGEYEHKEFLADINDNDFIRHFAESMISNLSENGSVVVYNQTFEGTFVNKELARMYPDLEEEILRINGGIRFYTK